MSTRIREIRMRDNISLEELSLKTGVCMSDIYNLENGHSVTVTVGDMLKISSALNMPVEEIFFARRV